MTKHITMLIQSNPRSSHRPTEGLRIALGLASSGHALRLILLGSALALIQNERQDFVDEEGVQIFLPLLLDLVSFLFIAQDEADGLKGIKSMQDKGQIRILSKKSLKCKIDESDIFLAF